MLLGTERTDDDDDNDGDDNDDDDDEDGADNDDDKHDGLMMMMLITTTTTMIMMMMMIMMTQQKFDTLSQTWPPQQVITHNLGINPAAALDWVSILDWFPLSPHPKNDISLFCLVNITNHILRHL